MPFTVEMTGLKRLTGLLTFLVLAASLGVVLFSGRPDRAVNAAVMAGLALIPGLGWVYFSVRLTVDEDSISWARFGRYPVVIAWREMTKVEFRSFARRLVISADDGRRIRIEEQIDRSREIYDLVVARVPGLVPNAKRLPWPIKYSTGGMSRLQCGLLAFAALAFLSGSVFMAVFERDVAAAFLGGILSSVSGFAATRIPMRYELGSDAVVVSFLVGHAVYPVSSLWAMERRVLMHNGVAFDVLVLRFGRKNVALAGMFTETPLHVIEDRLRLEYAARLASPALHPE